MMKVEITDGTTNPNLTVLYQGPPKSGKTHCAASWPQPGAIFTETNKATLRKFPHVSILRPDSPQELEQSIIPTLEKGGAEKLFGQPTRTIVLDSMTEALSAIAREIQGPKEKMTMNDFGRFLVRGETMVRRLVGLSQSPGHHVVMTVHERDVTTDDGSLVRVTPSIMGQLKDLVARFFDTVLICECKTEFKVRVTPGAVAVREPVTEYRVWSVPPDQYRSCGDGVGGGVYNRLPPSLDGTYPSLAKAWGLDE